VQSHFCDDLFGSLFLPVRHHVDARNAGYFHDLLDNFVADFLALSPFLLAGRFS
jgi:hypothetical protein